MPVGLIGGWVPGVIAWSAGYAPATDQLASGYRKMSEKGIICKWVDRPPPGRIQLASSFTKMPEKGAFDNLQKRIGSRPVASSWLGVTGNCQRKT